MALITYQRRLSVQAEQFLVESIPWPNGVVAVGSGYAACYPEQNLYFQVAPGDYIVSTPTGPMVVAKADFENEFVTA